jgi:hypothetical protein
MRKIVLALSLALAVSGCAFDKPVNGKEVKCVGLADKEDSRYDYRVSVRNGVVATLLSPSVVIPVVTILWDIKCPVGLADTVTTVAP